MTLQDNLQARLQPIPIHRSTWLTDHRHVVRGWFRHRLLQQPHALLPKGHWQRLLPICPRQRGRNYSTLTCRCDLARQSFDAGMFEHPALRYFETQPVPDIRYDRQSRQRMSAQIKETVVDPHAIVVEHCPPDRDQLAFQHSARCHVRCAAGNTHRFYTRNA